MLASIIWSNIAIFIYIIIKWHLYNYNLLQQEGNQIRH